MTDETYKDKYLEPALNSIVVVVEKSNTIIRGTLTEYGRARVKLENAAIKGRKNNAEASWIIIERSAIAHIHPEASVEPK
jgi:small nuclear ribonucleoprotein (snRNP)-like protein